MQGAAGTPPGPAWQRDMTGLAPRAAVNTIPPYFAPAHLPGRLAEQP